MSGPKCDAIELEEQERKRQEKAYLQRLLKAQEKQRREVEEKRRQEEEERHLREAEKRRRLEAEVRERQEFDTSVEALYQEQLRIQRQREKGRQQEEQQRQQEQNLRDRFYEALSLYKAAAVLAGKEPQQPVFDPFTAGDQILRMQKETEQLREQFLEQTCRREVNELIDQVITDMGYQVIAERITEADKGAQARLYRYDENTVISVISVDGQFTMEVVAVDQKDRPVTREEADRLYGSMERFCEDYEKIRKKLLETGKVVSKNIFHMPPDRGLARVVNRSEYQELEKRRRYGDDYTAETVTESAAKENTLP